MYNKYNTTAKIYNNAITIPLIDFYAPMNNENIEANMPAPARKAVAFSNFA